MIAASLLRARSGTAAFASDRSDVALGTRPNASSETRTRRRPSREPKHIEAVPTGTERVSASRSEPKPRPGSEPEPEPSSKPTPTSVSVSALAAAPALAFVSGPGTEISSLPSGTAALALGLAISFLAPVVVAVLLVADTGVHSERAEPDATAADTTRRNRPTLAATDDSPDDERTISTHSGRSGRSERSER